MIAAALIFFAGCASTSEDTKDAWFGDLRSLFSSHDDSAKVVTPTSMLTSSGDTSPAPAKAADPNE
jgi:hypothetical protein